MNWLGLEIFYASLALSMNTQDGLKRDTLLYLYIIVRMTKVVSIGIKGKVE